METKKVAGILIFWGLILSIVAVGILLVRLERDMVYRIVVIVVVGIVLALIIAASALPIRAFKTREGPHEREIIREKHTHTIDGRTADAPKIYTIGQQAQGFGGMFPNLLRAAHLAGERQVMGGQPVPVLEAEVEDVTGGEWEEWEGPITGAE